MPAPHRSVNHMSMQASDRYGSSDESQESYPRHNSLPRREGEYQLMPQNYQSFGYLSSDNGSQEPHVQYCTLESSMTRASCVHHNSPSTFSFSTSLGSAASQQDYQSGNIHGSPLNISCSTEDPAYLKHKLRELETAMLGPDLDAVDSSESSFRSCFGSDPDIWKQLMDVPKGDLKETLIACARAVAENDAQVVDCLMPQLRQMVSVSGEPIQRVGAYMLEGLIARLSSSGSSIYKALKCKEPTSSDLLSYMHILYDVCPYFKFAYLSANGAIAEALKNEDKVHIIDFQIAQGSQWITLIQALAARPGGPPHVRITGIDDAMSAYARGGGLNMVGRRLFCVAKSCGVPLEFHAADMPCCDLEVKDLAIQPGDALAVNFPFQLHHVPDESVSTKNHRDRILRMVKSLSPKVVTLVEQESNTNTAPLFQRFVETLNYYSAIFESVDVTLPRESKERINVEQHCLARDIVNIIACEGAERVERHELFGKWKSRFTMAGFSPYPLSPLVNATIKSLLADYCENYTLEERDGALFLGWKNRLLSVSSAWR